MVKCKSTKYSFVCVLIGICVFVFYLSFVLNSCLFGVLKRFRSPWKNAFSMFHSRNSEGFHYIRNVDNIHTVVRVVPLNWQNEIYGMENHSKSRTKYLYLKQHGLTPTRKLPNALIIGVKKAGTRALLEFVRLHPDVRAAGSEVHFFDKFYKKGFHWYRHHMPPTLQGQVTMEKTPSYFITREVPKRIHSMNPSTRLIVVVRDPVTRAISDYAQAASKRPDMKRFEDLAFYNGTDGTVDTSWGPVKIGVYARYLERWLRYFSLNQLLFVSGERLIVDPAAEMIRVQDFLGLKRVVTEKYFYFNATKGFPCLLKSEGRSSPRCLGKTKGRSHPQIDSYALERLRNFYRPFNIKFYQMTGISFGWP